MTNMGSRKESLEKKIDELEDTLEELRQQLRQEIESEQHAAIEQLDVYLDAVNHKFASLQGFWEVLREEISSIFKEKHVQKDHNE